MPGRYPTPAQTSLYINGVWIDDAYRVSYSKTNPLAPLYGYNEEHFSAVALGKTLVTGSLIISYRYPGYLMAAIKNEVSGVKRKRDLANEAAAAILRAPATLRVAMLEEARQRGFLDHLESQFTELFAGNGQGSGNKVESPVANSGVDSDTEIKIYFDNPEVAYHVKIIQGVQFSGESMEIDAGAAAGGSSSVSGRPLFEAYSFIAKDVVENIVPGNVP